MHFKITEQVVLQINKIKYSSQYPLIPVKLCISFQCAYKRWDLYTWQVQEAIIKGKFDMSWSMCKKK